MAEPRLDIQQLQIEAQHRWLRPAEICEILRNYQMFQISSESPSKPLSGSLFLFDRKVLRYFRKDGHNWRKKKDGKTVKEAHEKLKVGSVEMLHCYYAHGEENENFQRRSYWMLEQDMMHIVFVHYLDVKVNKANIGRNVYTDEVASDSKKGSSTSSGFPSNYSSARSRSTDSMSPTSTLTSLCEDADSGDLGQSLVQGDKSRATDTTYIEGQKAHGMTSSDNVMEQSAGLHTDSFSVSFPSIPSSSKGNGLEHTVLGNVLGCESALIEEAGGVQSLRSNWQVPFEDNTGNLPKWSLTQSLNLVFGSDDYSAGLLGDECHNARPNIVSDMFAFDGELQEQPLQANFSKQLTDAQSQHALKSSNEYEVPSEACINYALKVKHALLDGEDSLKKVDSFSRWITKELADVDNLHMQSSSGISWNTDESGHVIDDTSPNPSLSQDQLFSIYDFSPKWAYTESEIEVLVIGTFLKSQPEVATCNWSCMFGEVEVPADVLSSGILRCQAPPHTNGRVPFYVTCSNRFACSEVREFEYIEGFVGDEDFADCFCSSTEMTLHSRLEELLSLNSVHPSNQVFEDDMEKRNLVFKLISMKEEDEYLSKEKPAVDMDIQKLKERVLHGKAKEKLYSWLLHKVTESGKGPNVVDDGGQGVLHLVAALGYDWAITPIITAGVNINFRDVNGWTALHWAAFCGRERTVAALVSMGAAAGALTDPSPAFPSGRTPADLASSNGHKGISGFLAESLLTSHLESLKMDDLKENSGMKAVETVSERVPTPVLYGDIPDALCLKDSLTAVRNATQAADRIHQVFRMQSFHRKQLAQYEDDGDELGLLDQQALSLLASKAGNYGLGEGLANAAATQIQKKFRGWTKRKEFLIIRQRIVKIQAHVRGHQVRKQYKPIVWSVGILEKVILRWRRKGSGLRGFRPDALTKATNQADPVKEDDYDFLKEGRKQSEERFQKALSRVKSMVQYPEARAQYRRVLNGVDDFRRTKESNFDLINAEETVDGVEDLIDIDMLLDDNFLPLAFD
ncbi:hypothetical protein RIF29_36164 [Crotalaria pallida]|uniref:CG-1 domain-containing protein n=1 Tax=Crotalaria pallida TaxID=3830 RepID=A0AAN9EGE5_CROPI